MWQIDDESAYVLHTLPFQGSSLICEVFTQNQGRVKLLALSARGPKSRFRGVFRTFNLLKINARGNTELRKVTAAYCLRSIVDLQAIPLLCGYYLHELLRYCLPLEEPAQDLFLLYENTLEVLCQGNKTFIEKSLRQFEKKILEHCGYGIDFEKEAITQAPIDPTAQYEFILKEGFILKNQGHQTIPGEAILKIGQGDLSDQTHSSYAKGIFRQAIAECLQGKKMMSRELLKSFL
jgi:DNA repair protein RecO (recombination protein O)